MKTKQEHKKLFQHLEQWGQKKNSYSIDDFLKEKGIAISDFEPIANSSKKFMDIWGAAESQAWENLQDALFKKSLPRSRIAEYIRECDVFQDQDPEEVMQSLEETQAKLELYLTAIGDTESLRKYGRLAKMNETEALMKCLLERGSITEEQYADYLQIEKDCEEYDDED
jgi:hypothetical protein